MTPPTAPPDYIAHADWGTDPRKRQVATAALTPDDTYRVMSLAAADPTAVATGDLRVGLHVPSSSQSQLLAGFDFPIGLPRVYAKRVGVVYFPDFLPVLGTRPWERFYDVAMRPGEITIHRPFYPHRPGGTSRAHLVDGLGLTREELRRRCEGNDAETLFWTLGASRSERPRWRGGGSWRRHQARSGCGHSRGR